MRKRRLLTLGAVLLTAATALFAAGCGTTVNTDENGSAVVSQALSSAPVEATGTVKPVGDDSKYPDTLEGLISYMIDSKCVEQNKDNAKEKMQAQVIGATAGLRYHASFEGSNNITVELYAYDPAKLNADAARVLGEVKKGGKFTLFGKELQAYLSDNGKYLMVYSDSVAGQSHSDREQDAVEVFQSFKK